MGVVVQAGEGERGGAVRKVVVVGVCGGGSGYVD
jgi:hypothetical protein